MPGRARPVEGLMQGARGYTALREVADRVRGRWERRTVRRIGLFVVVVFNGQPEESFILAVVDFGNPNPATEAGTPGGVGLVADGNACRVIEEGYWRPSRCCAM